MKCPRCGENHSYLFSIRNWDRKTRGFKCKRCKKIFYVWTNNRFVKAVPWLWAFSLIILDAIFEIFEVPYLWIWVSVYAIVAAVVMSFLNIKYMAITVDKSEQQLEHETLWGILPVTHQGKWRIPPIILILLCYSVFMGFGSMSRVNNYFDTMGPWSKYIFNNMDSFFFMLVFFLIMDIVFIRGDFKFTKNFAMLLFIFHIVDFILIPLDFGQMIELKKIFISKLAMCGIIIFNIGIPLIWLKVLHFSGFKKLFSETFGLIIRDFRKV